MAVLSGEVESVAHVIQVALTPVFLFSGVATLLAAISARLGRVADRVDLLSDRLDGAGARERALMEQRLAFLQRRTKFLDAAVILATLAGMSTLLAAGLLFLGVFHEPASSAAPFAAFGVALAVTIGALTGYLCEMLLASIGIRVEAKASAEKAAGDSS